ncbi:MULTISPECIES: hypothetical protein [Streptomyces]|uniref:hypothetical protein n=1 Tax=Streptomyces TaxID=1883 RepID=UPI002109C51F|nr:hypothetical protein [Streptomyces longispororuber]MCQ4211079.1 hypothetical protein [Streptomyces longispororuber]
MAASAHLLLSALSKHADTVTTGADTTTYSYEPPLTSEPPFADYAPLTSEPPMADEAPLTSEPTPSGLAAG